MRRTLIAFLVSIALMPIAKAQERTMKPDAPGMLRLWPQTGHWQVALFRGDKGPNDLVCLLATAIVKSPGDFNYIWGIIEYKNTTGILIDDKNKFAVSGKKISVIIDGVQIGKYKITKIISKNSQKTVISALSKSSASRIETLFSSGGKVEFKTRQATYSSSLLGASAGIYNLHQCIKEKSYLIEK